MVIGSTMKGDRIEAFAREMEAQGARTRKTKKGLMIYAPDGATLTVHTTNGDRRALTNDITWFRRHGLVHPLDKKGADMAKPAATNEEGYPLYVTGPINATTRKRVLAELESKGWPIRVRPTELVMDTVTATRALYNVGYRWDLSTPAKRRVWVAPDDIQEMHEKVKAEMARREQESREARAAAHAPVPMIPTPKEIGDAIEAGEGDQVIVPFDPGPAVEIEPPTADPTPEEQAVPEVPEREFIDTADSWTVHHEDMPPLMTISDLIWTLEASGLNVEIRVWKR